MHKRYEYIRGFTIVELLVVIVIIGILATVTIVSFTGVNDKAIVAAIKSDLSISARSLKLYNTDNGKYPDYLDGNLCPVSPPPATTDMRYCLKKSSSDTVYVYSSDSPWDSFTLTSTRAGKTYLITQSTVAVAYVPPVSPIFDTGGVINPTTGNRTHTFGTECTIASPCEITATDSGTITIVLSGGGAGGTGADGGPEGPGDVGGDGGSSSYFNINTSTTYTAFGGFGNGGDGSANTPGGFVNTAVPIDGGGGSGGAGGYADWCSEREGPGGGSGGKAIGTLSVSAGQTVRIIVGAGGSGGAGYGLPNDCSEGGYEGGDDGTPGSVVISYSY